MSNKETQFAEVTVRIAMPFDTDLSESDRQDRIASAVARALDTDRRVEFFTTLGIDLGGTETMEETGERRMAEQEARHEARMESMADRYFEGRGSFRGP